MRVVTHWWSISASYIFSSKLPHGIKVTPSYGIDYFFQIILMTIPSRFANVENPPLGISQHTFLHSKLFFVKFVRLVKEVLCPNAHNYSAVMTLVSNNSTLIKPANTKPNNSNPANVKT